MKRSIVLPLVLVVGVALVATTTAAVDPAGETRLVSGEVVSLAAYLIRDLHGEDGRDAGVFQVEKLGLPLAIVEDDTGDVYVAVWKGPRSAQDRLLPLMGVKVNAQGPVYERGGVRLIEIQVVAEQ
ncbi:MAG: hypothetical protein R3190_14100 [Thermoanaerobaculia bacterium]|nr:hypothetical protein [Thermoanaerobaculia bacterium]